MSKKNLRFSSIFGMPLDVISILDAIFTICAGTQRCDVSWMQLLNVERYLRCFNYVRRGPVFD